MNTLSFLQDASDPFPAPEFALTEPNGLLAVGGDLHPERLLSAYYQGIFPWFNHNDPILWWSPDPRAIFLPGSVNVSRSLRKYMKKMGWRYTINHAFADVVAGCAMTRQQQPGTWITGEMRLAYQQLHELGRAHSIEVWQEERLIGGLYGLNVGLIFCGESMFHRETNASKAAFVVLHHHLLCHGFKLIDAQVMNPHLASLGARSLDRRSFIELVHRFRDGQAIAGCWAPQEVEIAL
ncbi:leucyl/phenylalanyl-tRNA--protein transferase [Shewanella avicenniae]|uniref:Leucyl/phenylalanyl-tRNA--protein transferase n=1 Tax=Shewanella avicenniae TaxID=2814294 RepID=A0ABX7QL59_9GAMM|nr:leucyl/phenylalanyl-tRNA--protein transferase [Shewanella avicenniae]QSX32189.1 leucyl/phenylalanyl-tRNA--protein transferase [Shewanella avicenniae]